MPGALDRMKDTFERRCGHYERDLRTGLTDEDIKGPDIVRCPVTRPAVWLAIASAMMLVTALVDLLPDAMADAVEAGVPIWVLGAGASF